MPEYKKPKPEERVREANKKICDAVGLIESAQEMDLEWAFNDAPEWNDDVRYDIDKALKYLCYVIATLSTWEDDLKEGEQNA